MTQARMVPAGTLGVLFVLLVVMIAAGQGKGLIRIEDVLEALRAGEVNRLSSMFRYFEEVVGANEAAKDRQILTTFAALVNARLGLVGAYERARETESGFANAYLESATVDLWRNSDCLFKSYAFTVRFVRETRQWPGEIWLDVCVDGGARPRWLRRIDVHLVRPDEEALQTMRALFQALQQEIRKIRGPRT